MEKSKILFIGGALAGLLLLIAYSWMIAFTDWGLDKKDHEFINNIQTHLKTENDKVKVEDVFPGNWDSVCFVSEYERTSKILNSQFGINPEGVNYEIGYDAVGNDGVWAVVFFEKPDKAYVFSVPSNYYFYHSGTCEPRESAYLERTSDTISKKYMGLKLISN